MSDVVVVGSVNVDLPLQVDRLPLVGETISAQAAPSTLGGKGANQAVACSRLGVDVQFLGLVGRDDAGDFAVARLNAEGVTMLAARRSDRGTGRAFVLRGPAGESTIILVQGANGDLTAADVQAVQAALADAACVLLQLEIGDDAVRAAADAARGLVVLNPAPARAVPPEVLHRVDVLVPNRLELAQLLGLPQVPQSVDDVISAARHIDGPKAIVVTLGEQGCVVLDRGRSEHIPAAAVTAVDTTAAGDSFCGALVVDLLSGHDLSHAAHSAARAAAFTVTKQGAADALPTRFDLRSAAPDAAARADTQEAT